MDEETKQKIRAHRKRLRPAHIIVAGFLTVIVIGSILLCLPISSKSRTATNYLDALFTATSAVCVTGLVVVDTATHFSFFGQAVLLLLIQIGGLGFMSLTTMFLLLLRRKITLKDRLLIKEALNQENNHGIVRLARNMLLVTFGIEGVGFLLLLYPFVSHNGGIGVWQAFFCAVSAFCNAGFDVLSVTGTEYISLGGYAGNVLVNLSISLLIILGGLGFTVLMDLGKNKGNFKKLSLHSKIVLLCTATLVLAGWLFFLLSEFTNKATLGNLSAGDRVLAALFQSVTTRTAGFATVSQGALRPASKLGSMLLMFVGASPGSTGGGIKTTTLAVLLIAAISGISNSRRVTLGKRHVRNASIRKSLSIFLMGVLLVLLSTLVLLMTERGSVPAELLTFENVLFESFSAYGTVGLSCGITPYLSIAGKIILMLMMFLGRVGTVTVGLMFVTRKTSDDLIRYPDADIMIG